MILCDKCRRGDVKAEQYTLTLDVWGLDRPRKSVHLCPDCAAVVAAAVVECVGNSSPNAFTYIREPRTPWWVMAMLGLMSLAAGAGWMMFFLGRE